MKIFYIYHSGFAVETEKYKLIFDYYMEPKKDSGEFRVKEFIVERRKYLFFHLTAIEITLERKF